jgi:N-acyl-D-amino-acid deacylase
VVAPGFIDAHSHLDGNATWEQRLRPSSGHGITTTVFGNCGVGFAPCPAEHRSFAVALMEGVEDIPAEILDRGLPWEWETFPEYLRFLDRRVFDMNVGALLPHSLLRVTVMGERAIAGGPATPDDIRQIAALTAEAISAGALGVGSTRLDGQRTLAGVVSPSAHASEAEYVAVASAIADAGGGVLQVAPEFNQFPRAEYELAMLVRVAAETGVPVAYTLKQTNEHPDGWRRLLDITSDANSIGTPVHPVVLGRPTGAILTWECSTHHFVRCPTYEAIADLPLDDRIAQLARPAVRQAILTERAAADTRGGSRLSRSAHLLFELGDDPDYEPRPTASLAARAAAEGTSPAALAYDTFMSDGGRGALLFTSGNYSQLSLDPALEMMRFPGAVLGLGDAGAHSTIICDASAPTTMLSYWTRDRVLGDRLDLPFVVRKLTAEIADLFGLADRGLVEPGRRADLTVFDHERVRVRRPRMDYDLPGGGRRLVQDAEGYAAVIVNGVVVARDDRETGELGGRLLGRARP